MRRAAAWTAGLALAAGPAAATARAAAGDLDPSFSSDGRAAIVADGNFVPRAIATQPDGRIVVAGATCVPDPNSHDGTCLSDGESSFRLARFTPDGGLDPEFGALGLVTTPINGARSQAFDVLTMPDGRILAGGVARPDGSTQDSMALVRYEANGKLDTSFGAGGIVVEPVGSGFSALAGLTLGPNGTIYATGQAGQQLVVARFTDAGALDQGFGAGGLVTGGPAYGYGLGAVPTADGGIVAAGIAGDSTDPTTFRFGELRLTASGAPDGGFGSGGFAEQRLGTTSSFANAAAATPDGGWVAAGAATQADNRQAMAVARSGAGGSAALAWTALASDGQGAIANDVTTLPDGRVVAAGQVAVGGGLAFGVARFTAGGALDPAFGGDGFVTVPWDRFPYARATAVAAEPDGRVVTAGVGCAGGDGGTRCTNGTAVLLLARQLADPPAPAAPAPTPTPTPTPATPAPARDTTKPTARLRGWPSKRLRRSGLRRKGLTFRLRASEPVKVEAWLTGPRRGSRRKHVALGHVKLRRPRTTITVRLKPGRRALSRTRSGTLALRLRLTDAAGNATTLHRRVRLR